MEVAWPSGLRCWCFNAEVLGSRQIKYLHVRALLLTHCPNLALLTSIPIQIARDLAILAV